MKSIRRKISSQAGNTLIEVMITAALIMIIMISGLNFFYGGQMMMNRSRYHRLAMAIAENRVEQIYQHDYKTLSTDLSENNTGILIDDIQGWRTTKIMNVDDPLDGTGDDDADSKTATNILDYKKIVVTVTWPANKKHQITLTTFRSDC